MAPAAPRAVTAAQVAVKAVSKAVLAKSAKEQAKTKLVKRIPGLVEILYQQYPHNLYQLIIHIHLSANEKWTLIII